MRMENKNESRYSCARAAVDCVYTLHTLRLYNVMLTKKSVYCMAHQNRLHGIPILYLFLKNSAFFGRPSALILPFLPFPRRNFEKRKGSPSFFKFQEKYGFLDRYSINFENISRKIIASIKILLCSDSCT